MNYRLERKFVVPRLSTKEIYSWLFTSKLLFRRCYDDRLVNNIYFDTPDFGFYRNAVNGSSKRLKVRIRWYKDHSNSSVLEVKFKNGYVGSKLISAPFDLYSVISINGCRLGCIVGLNEEFLPLESLARSLIPSLKNSYNRSYFLSSCGIYRVTIDSALSYQSPRQFFFDSGFRSQANVSVLEVKYNASEPCDEQLLLDAFPWRLSKNSKYVNGINAVYG